MIVHRNMQNKNQTCSGIRCCFEQDYLDDLGRTSCSLLNDKI